MSDATHLFVTSNISLHVVVGRCQGNKAAAIKSHVTPLDKKAQTSDRQNEVEVAITTALRYLVVNIQFIGIISREIPCQ